WPQPNGSDVKEGIPWGVVTGMSAVHLAKAGMTGAIDLVDHAPFFDAPAILAPRPQPAICETYTKFFAACRHVHAPVEAFIAVVEKHGLSASEITRIEVAAYSGALRIPNRPDPRNLIDAQYSIPYCIALIALRGRDVLLPMTEINLHDVEAEALAKRVYITQNEVCEARFPEETPVIVSVHTKDNVYSSEITTPSGEANDRPSWTKRKSKFTTASRGLLDEISQNLFIEAFEEVRNGRLTRLRNLLSQKTSA
ncbi:MAG: 2-methylcitrate dehydratase, partial [Rhodothermales bacterium]